MSRKNKVYATNNIWLNDVQWYCEIYDGNKIEKVIYNNPRTIVYFADGTKIVVKCHNEEYDKEKGVMAAVVKKIYGRCEFDRIVAKGKDTQESTK